MKDYEIKECTAFVACGKFFATRWEATDYVQKERIKDFVKQIIFSDEKFAGLGVDALISDFTEKILNNKEDLLKILGENHGKI